MRSRRRHIAVLFALAAALVVPFARPAAAAPVTNACFSGVTATYSNLPISVTGSATPDPATAGVDQITLANTAFNAEFEAGLFLAGYRLFILSAGANSIDATIDATVKASNTSEGSQTQNIDTSVTVTIVDPTPATRTNGDESAQPLTVNLPLTDSTWTPTGGNVAFTQGTFTVHAQVGAIAVDLGPCNPSLGLTGCTGGESCTGFTPNNNPAPFETVTVEGGSTTTSSSTTSTTAGATTTTTSNGSTTTTAGATTTTAPPQYLAAKSANVAYTCKGADAASQDVLDTLGSLASPPVPPPNRLDLSVALTTKTIDSPAKGEQFKLPIAFGVALPETVVTTAARLGITSAGVSDVTLRAGVASGATGPDVSVSPADRNVALTGSNAGKFDAGSVTGTFTRTGSPGTPIVIVGKNVDLTASVDFGGTDLVIRLDCDPKSGATQLRLVDGASPGGGAGGGGDGTDVLGESVSRELPRTGTNLWVPFIAALIALDLGYLARSATAPARARRRKAVAS